MACDIVIKRDEKQVFFLCPKFSKKRAYKKRKKYRIYARGGGNMRTKITLACTECKQRNYDTTKEKRNHPDRMETKKYCRFCRKHTMHKETK